MISSYKPFGLLMIIACMYIAPVKGQNENTGLRNIYGDTVAINPGDSTVLIVSIKGATCTGCLKHLVNYLQSIDLSNSKVAFIFEGGGGVVYQKMRWEESRQWIPQSHCYFYYSSGCAGEPNRYTPLLEQCKSSPCLGILSKGEIHIYDSDSMFLEEDGYLSFKESFLNDFSSLVQ